MTGCEYSALLDQNSGKAHEILFNEYYNYVRAVVFNRLRSIAGNEDIEECISDVFADVFFYFSKPTDNDLKGYIGTVAKRISIDWYKKLMRSSGRNVSIDDDDFTELSSGEDIVSDSEHSELRRILMNCIKTLGEPDSSIIIQKFYYNMDSVRIGKTLDMKPSAVRMRCKRAAEKLRMLLESYGIKEDLV